MPRSNKSLPPPSLYLSGTGVSGEIRSPLLRTYGEGGLKQRQCGLNEVAETTGLCAPSPLFVDSKTWTRRVFLSFGSLKRVYAFRISYPADIRPHVAMTILPLISSLIASTSVAQASTSGFSEEALGTGLEWMTIAAVLVPAVLCAVLVYLGSKSTIR